MRNWAFFIALMTIPCSSGIGAVYTWDGGGANTNWATAANWNPDGVPVSANTTDIVFTGSVRPTNVQNIATPFILNEMIFNAAMAAAWTVSGNQIRFDGAGAALTQNSTFAATLSTPINLNTTILANGTGTGGVTLSGVISGAGGITKSGTHILTMSGTNTYTGVTTINDGILSATSNAALGSTAGGTVVNSGGTLRLSANRTIGAEALTLNGTGYTGLGALQNLSGTNTYQGAITLGSNSTITSTAGTLTLSTGALSLGSNTLTFDGAGAITDSKVMSGTGNIIKTGTGTTTVSGANTYSGTTTINNGILSATNATALGSTAGGTVVNSGGTLRLSNNITIGAEALTLNGTGYTSLGALQNLSGNNTYQGAISLGSNSTITSTAGTLTLSTGGINLGASTLTFNASTGTITENSVISGTGNVIKSGTGILAYGTQNNTYTGTTTINDGTLTLNGTANQNSSILGNVVIGDGVGAANSATLQNLQNEVIANTAAVTLAADGRFNLNGMTETVGSVAGSGNIVLGAGQLITGGNNNSTTSTSIMSGTGAVTKNGTGTWTVSGANTYSGATTINNGILSATTATALGTTAGGTTVNNGGTLRLSNNITIGAEALTLNGTGYTGLGALQNLSGTNTYQGAITLGSDSAITSTAGTLTLSTGALALGSNTLTFDGAGAITDSKVMSGTGNIIKTGTGTTTVSGANTYSGTTTINNGILSATNATALGSTAGGTVVNSGGTLRLSNNITIGAEALTLNGTGYTSLGALQNLSGNNTYQGAISLGSDSTITSTAGTLTLSTGGINLGASTLTLNANTGTITENSIISGTGGVIKSGTGTVAYGTQNNTYTGTTTIQNGTLTLNGTANQNSSIVGNVVIGDGVGAANSATLQNLQNEVISDTSAVMINSDGRFNLNARTETVGSVAGSGNIVLGTGGHLKTGGDNSSTTSSSIISGAGAVTKNGTGTWSLTGANTFTGATTINAGTLAVNVTNSLQSTSNVTINSGGTLLLGGGAGITNRVNNAATVTLAGGTINTGGFTETLGALTMSANSVIDMGTGASVLTFASINVTGGALTVQNWSGSLAGGGTDRLVFTNTAGLTAGVLSQIQFNGYGIGAQLIGNELVPIALIPEAENVVAGLLLLLLAAGARYRSLRLSKKQQVPLENALR